MVWEFPWATFTRDPTVLIEGSNDREQIEKSMKAIPIPYGEFETFPKHVEEFFYLIAPRPFKLLEKRLFSAGCEFENFFRTEPELMRPIYLKLYETEETLVAQKSENRSKEPLRFARFAGLRSLCAAQRDACWGRPPTNENFIRVCSGREPLTEWICGFRRDTGRENQRTRLRTPSLVCSDPWRCGSRASSRGNGDA
jgi:hypothetical protein